MVRGQDNLHVTYMVDLFTLVYFVTVTAQTVIWPPCEKAQTLLLTPCGRVRLWSFAAIY